MPASKRPRKAHRPRIIARPVFEGMRRELMIPAHAALRVLERVSAPMCNRCALRMMCFSEHCANEQYCSACIVGI